MKTACARWKDALLEAALTGAARGELEAHLKACIPCSATFATLRARWERMDMLLASVASGVEPSPQFRARLLARVQRHRESKRARLWHAWALAGVSAAIVAAAAITLLDRSGELPRPDTEWVAAQRLADWRAPSDALLETPGQEFLRATPRLGEPYLEIPIPVNKED